MPIHQAAACGIVAPSISRRSNVPSPRLAIAHEASTIACPSAARRSGPPLSAGATAKPMGKKPVLMSRPAVMAEAALPPAARMETDASWAAPPNTRTDMAIAVKAPITGSASTPKDMPMASLGSAKGSPALMPSFRLVFLIPAKRVR